MTNWYLTQTPLRGGSYLTFGIGQNFRKSRLWWFVRSPWLVSFFRFQAHHTLSFLSLSPSLSTVLFQEHQKTESGYRSKISVPASWAAAVLPPLASLPKPRKPRPKTHKTNTQNTSWLKNHPHLTCPFCGPHSRHTQKKKKTITPSRSPKMMQIPPQYLKNKQTQKNK